jgi:GNAT superfamily N-acetyltransferase
VYRFIALILLLKTVSLSCFATAPHPPLFENDREFSVPGLSVSLRVLGTFISENDVKQTQHVSLAVITREPKVVGLLEFLYFIPNKGFEAICEWFLLHRVNIAESHRRKGYAGAAVETFLTALAQAKTGSQKKRFKKSQSICLTIDDQKNPFLVAFYEKFGFRGDEDQLSALVGPKQRFLFSHVRQSCHGKVMMVALGDAQFPNYTRIKAAAAQAQGAAPLAEAIVPTSVGAGRTAAKIEAEAEILAGLHAMLAKASLSLSTSTGGLFFQGGDIKRIRGYTTGVRVTTASSLAEGHQYYHLDIIDGSDTPVGRIVFSHFLGHALFGDKVIALDTLDIMPAYQRQGHAGRALECLFSALQHLDPPLDPETTLSVLITGKAFLPLFYGKFGLKKIPQAPFDASKTSHEVVERRQVLLSKVKFPYYKKDRAASAAAGSST